MRMSLTSAYGMVALLVDRFPSPMAAELRAVHGGRQAGSEVSFAVRSHRSPIFPTCLSDVLTRCGPPPGSRKATRHCWRPEQGASERPREPSGVGRRPRAAPAVPAADRLARSRADAAPIRTGRGPVACPDKRLGCGARPGRHDRRVVPSTLRQPNACGVTPGVRASAASNVASS